MYGSSAIVIYYSSSLLHAWHSVKTELASRASIHANFANQVMYDINMHTVWLVLYACLPPAQMYTYNLHWYVSNRNTPNTHTTHTHTTTHVHHNEASLPFLGYFYGWKYWALKRSHLHLCALHTYTRLHVHTWAAF